MRRQSFYVAGAIGVVVLSACSKKPQECKQIIGIIDDDDQQVEVAAAGRGPDPSQNAKAATDLAAAEDKIVADLSALTITTVDLKKGSDDYVAAAKDASTALKKVAAPLMKFAGSMSAGTDPYSRLDGSKAKIIQRCAPSPASHEAILKQASDGRSPVPPGAGQHLGDGRSPVPPGAGRHLGDGSPTDLNPLPECVQLKRVVGILPPNIDNPTAEAEAMNAFLVQVKAVPLTDPDMKTEIASFIRYAQDLIDADLAIAAFQTASQQVQVRADQATAEINTTCTGSP